MTQGVGDVVGPSSVALLQEKLFNDFTAVDHDVTTCTSLSTADKTNWVSFVHTFEAWYNIEPYTWSAFWTSGSLYDQGLQLQGQILSWQQKLTAAGCTLSEPFIQQPPPGIDWSSLKVIAVSAVVIGGVVLLYPIVREATATARAYRESAPPKPIRAHVRGAVHSGAKRLARYTQP